MNKKTIVSFVLIFASIALYVFVYQVISKNTNLIEAQVFDLKNKNLQTQSSLSLLEVQKNELNLSSEVAMNNLRNSIPIEMQQDMVIRDLISISDTNKVSLNSISFGKGGESAEGVFVLRVNAGFEGGFNDLIRFLEGLETNSRKFTVNSISVQLASLTVGGVRRANFSLAMETYFISAK